MGDPEKVEHLKWIKDVARTIIKAEKTTTGRVNLLGILLVGIAGIYQGQIFSHYGTVVIASLIISAVIAEIARGYRK